MPPAGVFTHQGILHLLDGLVNRLAVLPQGLVGLGPAPVHQGLAPVTVVDRGGQVGGQIQEPVFQQPIEAERR